MVANPTWRHYQYPFLGNDTGGFHERTLKGEAAEELYIRWTQFSSFDSIMEVFGSPQVPAQNSPFAWPKAVQDNFRQYTHLRLRLFPYIYSHALLTRLTGRKLIQGEAEHPLQYLFGNSFLVAPVYEPGVTNRTLWLPSGECWVDYWTGQPYTGGQEVTVPAPLTRLPLMVRAGAIIPLRDDARSVLRGNNATLTLEVYPEGATKQSRFTLYEDDGTSNAYLTNGFAATEITCNPGKQEVELQIGATQGDYTGRLKERRWKLEIHLASKPRAATIDNRTLDWDYDTQEHLLRAGWTSDTGKRCDILITR